MDILRIANVRIPYVVETLLRKDSLDLNDDDRNIIVERIQREPCERILITHGTDTMVETAQALESITDKTIVLVGSLNPAKFKNSDAEFNIGFAMAAVQTLEPGAYITMNGRIFSAGNVRKNRERNQFETVD
jgi:L-asparaginase